MSKNIVITVSPTGDVKIQTFGFAGPSCVDATAALEAALGERQSRQLTGEYYQAQHNHGEQSQRMDGGGN